MATNYNKRELDHYFKDIREDIQEIKLQTIKINGRVGALEKWKWMISGALIILSFIVANKLIEFNI